MPLDQGYERRSAAAFRAVETKRRKYRTWPTRRNDHRMVYRCVPCNKDYGTRDIAIIVTDEFTGVIKFKEICKGVFELNRSGIIAVCPACHRPLQLKEQNRHDRDKHRNPERPDGPAASPPPPS